MGGHEGLVVDDVGTDVEQIIVVNLQKTRVMLSAMASQGCSSSSIAVGLHAGRSARHDRCLFLVSSMRILNLEPDI